ncbi:MAG: SRPBCC family protein [Actinobacteria bacterium]|nr:SRPBCC family protein [Actinomycetota bacterium]
MELTNDFEVGVPIGVAWSVLTDVERIAPCLPGAKLEEIEGEEYRGIVKVKVGPITAQYKGAAHFVEKNETDHRAVLSASGRDTRGQGNASATITATLVEVADRTQVHVATDLNITGTVAQFGRGVMVDVSAKLLQQFVENLESTVLSHHAAAGEAAETAQPAKTAAKAAKKATKNAAKKAGAKKAAKKVPVSKPAAKPVADVAGGEPEPGPVTAQAAAEPAEAGATAALSGNGSAVRKIDSPEPEPVDLMEAAGSSVAKRVVPILLVLLIVVVVLGWRRRRRRDG